MHELVEFVSLSNPLELCSDHFHARLRQPAGIIKDPSVWLDGAGPPPKYIFKNNMGLTNSYIQPTWILGILLPDCKIMDTTIETDPDSSSRLALLKTP